MKGRHLCYQHALIVECCEDEARKFWTETMKRGVTAYTRCRWDAASIYLGTAYEIGLIRWKCEHNVYFSEMHLQKPLEFLLELHLADNDFDAAHRLMTQVRAKISGAEPERVRAVARFLDQCCEKIAQAEGSEAREWQLPQTQALQSVLVH